MRLRKLVLLMSTLLLLLLSAFATAQTQPSDSAADKAKKKKAMDELVLQMLDGAINDATALRLPGNRAIIDGMAADIYWKFDEKRARELFRNAANEIVAFNAEAEAEAQKAAAESTDPLSAAMSTAASIMSFGINDPTDPRYDVLNLVVKHDADLALEVLLQTRSARLAEAMTRTAATDITADTGNLNGTMDRSRAAQEISVEQDFSQRAANNDPDKMIKLIKDGIAKGVTTSLIPLLQNLNQKDAKKAADLGAEVIAKLADADMARNQSDLETAKSYLQQFAPHPATQSSDQKVKPFAFADASMKALANKVVDALLAPSKSMMSGMNITQAIPTLEKFVPERIAVLRQREAEAKKNLPTEFKNIAQQTNLWNPSTTAEDILAQLPKMTNENDKRNALSILPQKISQITDETRAKKLIDQITDEKTRASAQEQFDTARAGRAVAAGKTDEARRLIGLMTNRRKQISLLVALAMQVQKKGTDKDIENAKGLMTDAKALVKDYPDDEDDLADLMEVVRGYATVDPDLAFRLFEPMVDEFNNTIQASAVLSKYNKRDRTFKRGELVLRANNGGYSPVGIGLGNVMLFRYVPQLQALGKTDLEHMSLIADRFSRSDTRTIVRLFVLQGFLASDKKPIIFPPGGTGGLGSGIRP